MLNMTNLRSRVTLFVLPECGREIDRLRAEVARLETALAEAQRAAEALATYAPPEPAPAPRATAKGKGGRKPKGEALMTTEDFWRARAEAITRAGDRWHLDPESRYLTIPAKWRTMKTERGTTLRWNADQRVPGPAYWDGSVWPVGLVWEEPAPVTTDWDAICANRNAAIADQIAADSALRDAKKAAEAMDDPEDEAPEMDAESFTEELSEPEVKDVETTCEAPVPARAPVRPFREFAVPVPHGARPVPGVWVSSLRGASAPMMSDADLTEDELKETGD